MVCVRLETAFRLMVILFVPVAAVTVTVNVPDDTALASTGVDSTAVNVPALFTTDQFTLPEIA